MRTVRLLVAYDGTDFHGWQVQPGQRTVQGVIEEALTNVLEGEAPRVAAAGRTDAGVHARGQVGSFECEGGPPARAFAPLLNRRLPRDVRVRAAVEAASGFHARHSARERHYAYRVLAREDLLLERFAWRPRQPLDWERLEAATRPLECEADFGAFQSAGSPAGTTRCHVRRARWRIVPGAARFDIVANHFLYHMVRNIVGTAMSLARGADPAAAMRAVLESRDRRRAGATAPAHGLCLERVRYATGREGTS